MKLQIITPDKGIEIDRSNITFVEAEGINGQFGVLEGHLSLITPLKATSTLRYQSEQNAEFQEIKLISAVLEVEKKKSGTEVKIIASKLIS